MCFSLSLLTYIYIKKKANLGDLDNPTTRNGLVWGNLALIQVQALISGCIAGIFSVLLGIMQHPDEITTVSEIILVVASSMVSASVSSFVLGVFMCVLIIISRMLRIDPGNIVHINMQGTSCFFLISYA